MADLLRSAFGYFTSGSSDAASQHELVGRTLQLSEDNKLTVKKVLGEGGFGYVFLAVDARSGRPYALKRLCVDSDHVKAVKQEVDILKQLKGHPHIISFVDHVGIPRAKTAHSNYEFLIQTELCLGGPLVDIVNTTPLTPQQVLRVFYQTCLAVQHMHSQTPPIIHRDLKVENLLLDNAGGVKLCDFGSATTERIVPDVTWTHTQRGLVDEEIQHNTTPMYRTPEMVDLYSNRPITEKADVWALGCLLYKLCFMVHPFEDSGTLRILNAKYSLPEEDKVFAPFHGTIRSCLCVDPEGRPSVSEVLDDMRALAVHFDEDLNQPPTDPLPVPGSGTAVEVCPAPRQEAQSSPRALRKSTQQIWGRVKGGAGQLFKNIKDTSSRVMSSWGGRSSLDLNYITSRIIVMSFPGSNLDEVRSFLDTNHPEQYLVFNLSDKTYDTAALHGQVADFEWPPKRAPDLEKLVDLCRSLDSWLRADDKNVIVIHCNDGRLPSGSVVAAYLLFTSLFASPQTAYKLFSGERCLDGRPIHPPPSHLRYLGYISRLVAAEKPHSHAVKLKTLRITSVPLMDKERSLCQPYVEVFVNGAKVHTSVSKGNLKQIRQFTPVDKWVEIGLDVVVKGNVAVCVHHVKTVNADGTSLSGAKMFQIQFHSGFVDSRSPELVFGRSELDGGSIASLERYPEPFLVGLDVEVEEGESPTSPSPSWQNLPHPRATPLPCFATQQEELMVGNVFGQFDQQSVRQAEEDTALRTQTYRSIVHSHHGNQPVVVEPLLLLSGTPTSEAVGNLFSDRARADDPAHRYFPYGDEESSSSSDGEEEEALSGEGSGDIPHNLLLDPVDPPTGNLVNLSDSIEESVRPHQAEVHTEQPILADVGAAEVVSNSGFLEGDLLGLGIASSSSAAQGQPFDPFADTTPQPSGPGGAFSTLSPTPMQPASAPPTKPQTAADPEFMTFSNPAAFSDLGTQFHSHSTAGVPFQTQSVPHPKSDPFADLTSLGTQPPPSSRPAGAQPPPSSRPAGAQPPPSSRPKPQPTNIAKTRANPLLPQGRQTPVVGEGSRNHGNYSSVIGRRDDRGARASGGPAPLLKDQHFSDLLGSQGFTASRDRLPQTLRDLKGKQDIENSLDPETAKVREWAEIKKRNIRALLCDLHSILWEGEERWKPVHMKDLITADQVKKSFRKACLSVHPDKTSGTEQEVLAEAIFVELNKANALFEESGAPSLY